jgi:protein-S-isoprenylcysteine O-methyltransferase Ste14
MAGEAPTTGPREEIAGVVAPPPLVYLAGLGAGFALEAVLPSASLPDALRFAGGGALLVAGGALIGAFFAAFRRARTPVDVRQPTRAIATDGPYRLTRNPAYVGMALVYVGISLTAGAVWPFAVLPVVLATIDRGVIAREERYLERTFGEQYLAYKRRVRRWL